MLQKILAFSKTEYGRRLSTFAVSILVMAAQGGLLPIDVPIPHLGISISQLLTMLGINLAGMSGSQTRQ